jgi:hypothetical protein
LSQICKDAKDIPREKCKRKVVVKVKTITTNVNVVNINVVIRSEIIEN